MRFVDLFAGIGGFHRALAELGHECVFASELNEELRGIYIQNFPEMSGKVFGDIRKYKDRIPEHDVLCAGFPCQPFSKSGEQLGTNDQTRGTLFHELIEILEKHKPEYFIFENVGNFERHDSGNTWRIVKDSLVALGYDVRGTEHVTPHPTSDWRDRVGIGRVGGSKKTKLTDLGMMVAEKYRGHGLISPHHLGYPQTRERFFIVGKRGRLPLDPFPAVDRYSVTSLGNIIEKNPSDVEELTLTDQQVRCIRHWNKLLRAIPSSMELPSFPIWGDELDAKYPYLNRSPWATPPAILRKSLSQNFPKWTRKAVLLAELPSYAREETHKFRSWKIHYIHQNREWFRKISKHMPVGWSSELMTFPPSLRKLEWNVKGGERNLWRHMLQFRPSGLRVRRYDRVPALVSMTATQIPILGPEKRFLSRAEGLLVQGFPVTHCLPPSRTNAFAALGNAVHVGVIRALAEKLMVNQPSQKKIQSAVELVI